MKSFYSVVFIFLFFVIDRTCISTKCCVYLDHNPHLKGECVPIKECPILFRLLNSERDPRHWVDDVLRNSTCACGWKIPLVCCPDLSKLTTTTPALNFPPINFPPRVDVDYTDVRYHLRLRKFLPDSCGPLSNDNKIVNGLDAGLNEFPWMALLGYSTRKGLAFLCGGSLINPRYVLTAAHCLLKEGNTRLVMVRLGEHNIKSDIDCEDSICAPPVQDINIDDMIRHPQYQKKNYKNDIGLIRLSRNAYYNRAVNPVCLPIGQDQSRNFEGHKLTVTGWGLTEKDKMSPILQKVGLPVVSLETCSQRYNSSILLNSSNMCAGGVDGKDSCNGDSGGPLQTIGERGGVTRYIQYGIVSAGPKKCGDQGWPAIYTKVGDYMKWILDTMEE